MKFVRKGEVIASCIFVLPALTGCGTSTPNTSNLPPLDDSARYSSSSSTVSKPANKGMSGGQKLALLAGAAAVYYLYKKNQESHASGNSSAPQYYLSKNGRVYYRERGGRVHWVTAPKDGIMVPREEADQYQQYEGFEGRTTGRSLAGIGSDQ